ncbi:hypothetical protein LRAMOSA05058 [Lichtheimia ramosa]|uniref:Uncharacterized protein n=1 Tax=Lichtheimia ramosa TaxID=688394 RepID=A0A077X048_9FUNG|nr:hypothetical protein LRAMOSA05058 [Lichtheimia ramosa]
MLLKARQHDQGLTNAFTDSKLSDLHKCLRGRVTARVELFLAIKKIVEDVVCEDTTRATAKRKLMKLSFDDHDAPIIDMIINWISDLPRFPTSAKIGELELITYALVVLISTNTP